MKGTRLWQAPGSPIIQGRSRTERPFWERWLTAAAVAELVISAAGLIFQFRQPSADIGVPVSAAVSSFIIPALPGCVVGAAFGVWLSQSMGWSRHWLVGAVLGIAAGIASIILLT